MRAAFHVKRLAAWVVRASRRMVLAPILVYQRVSPAFPRRCRYEPTCSRYAVEAIRELGAIRGTILGVWRVLRCNPWSRGGIDPVAERPIFRSAYPPASRAPRGPAHGARR